MKKTLPGDVYERFKTALVDGGATSDEDQEAISKAKSFSERPLWVDSCGPPLPPPRKGG